MTIVTPSPSNLILTAQNHHTICCRRVGVADQGDDEAPERSWQVQDWWWEHVSISLTAPTSSPMCRRCAIRFDVRGCWCFAFDVTFAGIGRHVGHDIPHTLTNRKRNESNRRTGRDDVASRKAPAFVQVAVHRVHPRLASPRPRIGGGGTVRYETLEVQPHFALPRRTAATTTSLALMTVGRLVEVPYVTSGRTIEYVKFRGWAGGGHKRTAASTVGRPWLSQVFESPARARRCWRALCTDSRQGTRLPGRGGAIGWESRRCPPSPMRRKSATGFPGCSAEAAAAGAAARRAARRTLAGAGPSEAEAGPLVLLPRRARLLLVVFRQPSEGMVALRNGASPPNRIPFIVGPQQLDVARG